MRSVLPDIAKYAMLASMANSTDIIGTTEAMQILGTSRDTLIRMIARGEVKYFAKLGGPNGAYLYERTEIERVKSELAAPALA